MKTQSQLFSDDTLREARGKLLTRGALLVDRVRRVRADLRREHEPVSLDPRRPVTVPEHDDVLQAMEKSACAEILSIDAALERTEDGTLGVCEECGHEIEAERFAAVPYATHCVKCGRDG